MAKKRKTLTIKQESWLRIKPPEWRDVRKLHKDFWSFSAAKAERLKRIEILRRGGRTDAKLATALDIAEPGKLASVFCCPLVARRFQIFFTNRALKVHEKQRGKWFAVTLVDPSTAVPLTQAKNVEWRKLHAQLRSRIKRKLGDDVVAVGVGELEADYELGIWQPHHHLVIYGTNDAALERLRAAHYLKRPTGERLMHISKRRSVEGFFAYASKLMAFRKLRLYDSKKGATVTKRVRLKDPEFRHFMRYLARRRPTSFIFALNCKIAKKTTK